MQHTHELCAGSAEEQILISLFRAPKQYYNGIYSYLTSPSPLQTSVFLVSRIKAYLSMFHKEVKIINKYSFTAVNKIESHGTVESPGKLGFTQEAGFN